VVKDHLRDDVGEQPEDEGACDGVHVDGAPVHHLCTRCFSDRIDRARRGDLVVVPDDEQDRDEEGENE
jgi:hypothetical protein